MHRRRIAIVFALVTASGCARPPEAVFVDMARVIAVEDQRPDVSHQANQARIPNQSLPPKLAAVGGAKEVLIRDKAEATIDSALAKIKEERESAIRVLTRRLGALRSAEIDQQKQEALTELAERQSAYLKDVYDQLYAVFRAYARDRGPAKFRIEFLQVKKPDLFVSRTSQTPFAAQLAKELTSLRSHVKELDAEYAKQANSILNQAESTINAEQGAIQSKFETLRANALERAAVDARQTIGESQGATELHLGANRSVRVPATAAHRVTIPGSNGSPIPSPSSTSQNVTSEADRATIVKQQLEIWLKSRGLVRSDTRSGARDATDEFVLWRKTHQVGR
ncbi:MAG: hypothetical protein IT203_07685 [Fimbriimonadaceae bacterium]|nr:hypothetical protein [Fimbriimonadaceae bacterium]